MNFLKKLKNRFRESILDDYKRYKTQYLCTYFVLGTVSLFMTLVNIIDDTASQGLTLATLIFSILSYINVAAVYINDTTYSISKYLFVTEAIILFSYFTISGSPQGFSIVWALLLPTMGMVLFGKKLGSIVNAIMFAILVCVLWTPLLPNLFGIEIYEYSTSFKLRFPVAYVAFFFVGVLIENIRSITFENYVYLYTHDNLTRYANRKGFYDYIEKVKKSKEATESVGLLMFDLDNFKGINDTYGHIAGDEVLKMVSSTVSNVTSAFLCRWGGEEFVAFFPNGNMDEEMIDNIRKEVENSSINFEGLDLNITISVGAVVVKKEMLNNIIDITNLADDCLYIAKNNGKNQVVFKDYTKENV